MVGHVGMYGGGQPSVESPVLMLRNRVGWFSLGRWRQPSAQCRYRALTGIRRVRGSRQTRRAGGPRAERAHLRLSASAHGQAGRNGRRAKRPPARRSLRPCRGPFAVFPLRDAPAGAFIVSRSASFINTCTNTILERVTTCGSDSAITSDTLLPCSLRLRKCVAVSGAPTVRQRRLAAELRRLRGDRTGDEVAAALSGPRRRSAGMNWPGLGPTWRRSESSSTTTGSGPPSSAGTGPGP